MMMINPLCSRKWVVRNDRLITWPLDTVMFAKWQYWSKCEKLEQLNCLTCSHVTPVNSRALMVKLQNTANFFDRSFICWILRGTALLDLSGQFPNVLNGKPLLMNKQDWLGKWLSSHLMPSSLFTSMYVVWTCRSMLKVAYHK